jgi:predicted PurR-regulated permease PerM
MRTSRIDAALSAGDVPAAGRPASGADMLIICAIVVGALYFGRDVLVPLALALLLSFVLAPGVTLLRRWNVGRVTSALIMVACAFLVIFSLGAVITQQVTILGENLPRYEYTIRGKLRSLQQTVAGAGLVERASDLLRDLRDEIKQPPPPPTPLGSTATPPNQNPEPEPIPVRVQQPPPGPLEVIQSIIGPLLVPLATSGLVIVFAIFILLQREDLRDRFIRLTGTRDLQRTTKAITDAASRVSRFLLAQTVVNALVGSTVCMGLWIIGVPNPILWGILVMALRFVPYIGWIIAAAFPLALSVAIDPGWSMLVWTGALFLAVELLVSYAVEPLVFGTSLGLSALAVIVSATFWTWLWGPIGLMLSAPLTACVATLGRHVPHLQFLDVALGDQPVLEPEESLYQRLLAGDPSEAAEQAEGYLRHKPLSLYYDEVVLPALAMAQADVERGVLDSAVQTRLRATVQEVAEDLADYDDVTPEPEQSLASRMLPESIRMESRESEPKPKIALAPHVTPDELPPEWQNTPVHCIASRTDLDEAAAAVLATLLAKHGVGAKAASWRAVSGAGLAQADFEDVQILCLSSLSSQVSSHLKFLIRRLRRRYPTATVVVGFWSLRDASALPADRLAEIGADFAVYSLREALMAICQRALEASQRRTATSADLG